VIRRRERERERVEERVWMRLELDSRGNASSRVG
jgi:hypothetical protein